MLSAADFHLNSALMNRWSTLPAASSSCIINPSSHSSSSSSSSSSSPSSQCPSQRGRNSEKRKEKSRDAARCRRSKESEIFTDMSQLLPVPGSLSSQLDKASIMRLTIAYLKARALLGSHNAEGSNAGSWPEEKCPLIPNSYWPQALGGILMALSSEGDIIYLTENVTQQLGLPQVDLIGQSVYDYCHPCDHDELRDVLGWRADGDLSRSFFLRLKSTLSVKGRSSNLKAASYKVMNCSGRIVKTSGVAMATASAATRGRLDSIDADTDFDYCDGNGTEDEPDDPAKKRMPSHFLVLIADPIPHPSNIELPLDGYTFLTKHSLDMKYTYVDEKIADFLGYAAGELEGQSAYEFHHVIDNEMILKSYKTMFTKGQMQTQPYRFLARNGGYAWVQTQATLVYGSRDSRPQAIVCVHSCLSGIDEQDQILSASQVATAGRANATRATAPVASAPPAAKKATPAALPQKMTSKLFVTKTPEMNDGFLMPAKYASTSEVLKEELDDLTHLAPVAGDACIPLEIPSFTFPGDFFDSEELTPELLDCLPLTGFELPMFDDSPDPVDAVDCGDECESDAPPSATPSTVKEDPFIFFNDQAPCASNSASSSSDLFVRLPYQKKENDSDDEHRTSPKSKDKTDLMVAGPALYSDDDDELSKRAPYIPMGDDLPLFDTADLFMDFDLDAFPILPHSKTESIVTAAADQSVLVQLLQTTPVKQEKPPMLNYDTEAVQPFQAVKRARSEPESESNAKRVKAPIGAAPVRLPVVGQQQQQQQQQKPAPVLLKPSNTSSLMELLTEKPANQQAPPSPSSVLHNLLVSGHDSQTGHDLLHGRRGSKSPTSPRLASLPSSQAAWLKGNEPATTKAQYCVPKGQQQQQQQQQRNAARKQLDMDARLIDDSTFGTFGFDLDASGDLGLDASDFFSALNLPMEFSAANMATD